MPIPARTKYDGHMIDSLVGIVENFMPSPADQFREHCKTCPPCAGDGPEPCPFGQRMLEDFFGDICREIADEEKRIDPNHR